MVRFRRPFCRLLRAHLFSPGNRWKAKLHQSRNGVARTRKSKFLRMEVLVSRNSETLFGARLCLFILLAVAKKQQAPAKTGKKSMGCCDIMSAHDGAPMYERAQRHTKRHCREREGFAVALLPPSNCSRFHYTRYHSENDCTAGRLD